MTDELSFAEYLNRELMRSYREKVEAVLPCMLCGQLLAGHDQSACDAKMAAWKPVGFMSAPTADLQRFTTTAAPAEARTWTLPDMVGTRLTSNHRPHWATRAKITAEWRDMGHKRALEARIPRLARARIDVQWLPPTRARHDPPNAHPMIKALTDGIVAAGVLADDDSTHLDGPYVTLGPLTPVGRHMRGTATLRVVITELPSDAPDGGP